MKIFKSIIVLILLSCVTKAQNVPQHLKSADSLLKNNQRDKALAHYNKAINQILEDKYQIDNENWFYLLKKAGQVAFDLNNFASARWYWNMAYGTRAEKLEDKVTFLQDLGVNLICKYSKDSGGFWNIITGGKCTTNNKSVLIWFQNNNIYYQLFTDCDTYKPLKINNPELSTLYKNHVIEMTAEEFRQFRQPPPNLQQYHLEFIQGLIRIKKKLNLENDLVSPIHTSGQKEDIYQGMLKQYEANNRTYLANFLKQLIPEVDKYLKYIDLGEIRAKIGSF